MILAHPSHWSSAGGPPTPEEETMYDEILLTVLAIGALLLLI